MVSFLELYTIEKGKGYSISSVQRHQKKSLKLRKTYNSKTNPSID